MGKRSDNTPATIELFDDPFEALFDDPLDAEEARQRAADVFSKGPARSFEEWLERMDEVCRRMATDEEYRRSISKKRS